MTVLRPLIFICVVLAACWVGLRFAWHRHGGLLPLVVIGVPALWWAAIWGVPT